MLGMTPVWSWGKRMPSPATMWRMGSWVTAVTWTGLEMLGMTPVWSWGKRMPSPATMWRMGSWVTAVTWTGAGASVSGSAFLEQPEAASRPAARAANNHLFFIG